MSANEIQCGKCPHNCSIKDGGRGFCGVRENSGGALSLPYYGYITSIALDPIEKKPLCHFRPGTSVLSIGFSGCNLRCPFCQNWQISQTTNREGRFYKTGDLIALTKKTGFPQIAYTYSEPLIHGEFLIDCAGAAKKEGIANILVTNGTLNKEAADEVLPFIDAANIDLKCFSAEKYKNILKGDLDTVLAFIENAFSRKVHIEVTTLVVTEFNDDAAELERAVDFIAALSPGIPYHFSAYHPAYKYNAPPTDRNFLFEIHKKVKEKLKYVHLGNI